MKEKLIKNPDFTDWTDTPPDCKIKEGQELPEYNISVRRVYYFSILGIRFKINGKNLIK